MKIQSYNNANYTVQNKQNTPSFGDSKSFARKTFEKAGEICSVDSRNGSLSRAMFFVVALLFLVGGRFVKSRDNDERREVITRDIPAIALTVTGAPMANKAMAYATTKKTGVPIITLDGKKGFMNATFSSQKQLIDWYSNLGKNPLVNFSETITKHGGNLQKAFAKLGFSDKLAKITTATDNNAILNAIKEAQINKTEAFKTLEEAMQKLDTNNNLLKFAKKSQAYVKLAGIGITAAILGIFLPRLNIVMTRKKYQKKVDEGTMQQADMEKRMIRASRAFRSPSSGSVLSFHKISAIKTFKNLLSMAEPSSKFE